MNWFTSMFSGKAGEGDLVSATTMNVTKIVSIAAALFAGLTQALNSLTDAVQLSSTQMVTIWLVVAGLVVVLGAVDMTCRAYVTGRRLSSGEARFPGSIPVTVVTDPEHDVRRSATLIGVIPNGSTPLAHVRYPDKTEACVPITELLTS